MWKIQKSNPFDKEPPNSRKIQNKNKNLINSQKWGENKQKTKKSFVIEEIQNYIPNSKTRLKSKKTQNSKKLQKSKKIQKSNKFQKSIKNPQKRRKPKIDSEIDSALTVVQVVA